MERERIASSHPLAQGHRGNKLDPSTAIALRERAWKTSVEVPIRSHPAKVGESFRCSDAPTDLKFVPGVLGIARSMPIGMTIPLALSPPPELE